MKLPLCYYGNPILRKKSAPIKAITPEICKLIEDMIETLDQSNGIGLSAVQVGSLLRLFVLRRYIHTSSKEWTLSEPYVYINPHILDHSQEQIEEEEGCLSIPKISLPVRRPAKIKVLSTRPDGKDVTEEIEGINARVIFHENDHLNGVLYIDRVEKKYLARVQGELKALKKLQKERQNC